MGDRTLDYVALGVLIFVVLIIVYGVIYIHDIPYEIAKKRKHPHLDAIHTAGWVSLFLMHTIWPFLWIWASLYKPGHGWGLASGAEKGEAEGLVDTVGALKEQGVEAQEALTREIEVLKERMGEMERQLNGGGEK